MKIAFRADAGVEQGSGHVVRTLTLAQELQNLGHEVQIFGNIDNVPWLSKMVANAQLNWESCSPHKLNHERIIKGGYDLFVIDSYEISAESINILTSKVPTMAIVDNQTRGIVAQILLDHNVGATPFVTSTEVQQLIGPKFALVREEIRSLRRTSSKRVIPGGSPNLLVMIGGTDPLQISLQICQMIAELDSEFELNFVTQSKNIQEISKYLPLNRNNIHELTANIKSLLSISDVVISAAGTSTLDLSCIGIPSLYISVAANQEPVLAAVSENEIGLALDLRSEDWNSAKLLVMVQSLAYDEDLREKLFTNAQGIVDGLGSIRTSKAIISWIT